MQIDASNLPRVMQCGASRSMPQFSPVAGMDQNSDRAQGIAAHWLAMQRLTGRIADVYDLVDRKAENGYYISPEMADHVDAYCKAVLGNSGEKLIETPAVLQLPGDIRIDCRADAITHGQYTIIIDEFKYGWSIVEPTNWTMFAYAMAFCATRRFDHNVQFIFRIHQPRPYHPDGPVRSYQIAYTDLMVMQRDMAAHLGGNSGSLMTGPECKHCSALSNCQAARKASMNAIDMAEQALSDALPPDQMAHMLDTMDVAIKRLENYREALKERIYDHLSHGQSVANYKLEPTKGNLEWMDWVSPDALSTMFPGKPLTKQKTITPTQAKALLGDAVVDTMAIRPNKGLKLVRYDAQKEAQRMFGNKEQ